MRQLVETIAGILILFSTGQCVSEIPTGEELFEEQKTTYDWHIEDVTERAWGTFPSSRQVSVDQPPLVDLGAYV